MKKKRGFTLIELLVIISIIGFLAVLAIVSLKTTRAKARDARRMADIKQIQTALETYYDDFNAYPPGGAPDGGENDAYGGWDGSEHDGNGNSKYFIESLEGLNPLGKVYMAKVPRDPKGGAYEYGYYSYNTNPGSSCRYKLMTRTETQSGNLAPSCPGWNPGGEYYEVRN